MSSNGHERIDASVRARSGSARPCRGSARSSQDSVSWSGNGRHPWRRRCELFDHRRERGSVSGAGGRPMQIGNGGRYREVARNPTCAPPPAHRPGALDRAPARWPGAQESTAPFLDRRGGRLSTRGADNALKTIAADAHLAFGRDGNPTPTPYATPAGTDMIRDGVDIVAVAVAHFIDTARGYRLPPNMPRSNAWPSTSRAGGTRRRPCPRTLRRPPRPTPLTQRTRDRAENPAIDPLIRSAFEHGRSSPLRVAADLGHGLDQPQGFVDSYHPSCRFFCSWDDRVLCGRRPGRILGEIGERCDGGLAYPDT